MSLDITLYRDYHVSYDNGETLIPKREEVFSTNITHNLGKMAKVVGIYEALWRPYKLKEGYNISKKNYMSEYKFEEENIVKASEIISIIKKGLKILKENPTKYRKYDSPNGWGIYGNFLLFVERYLNALNKYPDSIVECNRHDYETCGCENKTMVDGGNDYERYDSKKIIWQTIKT
jgi:hypothetical protein